LLHSEVYYLLL